ncbi:MAG: quercetin dioxygenase-like cupin family protein [Polyangiales bacterium]|jgi:quercetin dioxygenase-like cupin family protein
MIRERDFDRRRWTEPQPDDPLNEATWERIERRLDAAPKRSLAWPVGVGVVLAAAAAMWLVLRPSNTEWSEGELVANHEAVVVEMEDGSSVEAAPHSRLIRQANRGADMHVQVAEGEATFDVESNTERDFVVHAGDVEVVVVGTRFSVERGDVVLVSVERGAVEIRRDGVTTVVSAGEIWGEPEENEELPVAELIPVEATELIPVEATEPIPVEATEPIPVEATEESSAVDVDVDVEPADIEQNPQATRPSAARLFEAAQGARRDGRHQEASRTYGEFLRHYPSHNNASLAAFELGRLKMDVLHDPRGAAHAFERAARRGSPFRQDAMARHVQALAASGDGHGCVRARTRYETAFPSGRHLAVLSDVCE